MAKQALAEGKCCVIGLQSTGEARTQDVVAEKGEELDDFVSGPRVHLLISRRKLIGITAWSILKCMLIASASGSQRYCNVERMEIPIFYIAKKLLYK